MSGKCEFIWSGKCDNEVTHIAVLKSPAGYGTFTKKYCKEHGEWAKGCGNFLSVQTIELLTLQPCPVCNPKDKIHTVHKTRISRNLIHFTCEACKTYWTEER